MKVLAFLLFPFSVLYSLVTGIRNRLYDQGYKPAASFEVPIISVGNLAVGGTGKTPLIEHLIRLLKPNYKIATLSRGYKRTTKGIRIARHGDNASTIGDEPFQFYKKFKGEIPVVVGEERALAIPVLMDEHPETEIILLDDAFQHRQVRPAFQILLTDYNHPFYKDFLLPAGRLRESRKGASRADAIVVAKCPDEISIDEMMDIEGTIRKYSDKPVFFTKVRYGDLVAFGRRQDSLPDNVILVSGLANAKPLENYVALTYKLLHHFDFPDHHQYSENELEKISALAKKNNAVVITSEKDAVKIDDRRFQTILGETPFFYVPIEIEFLKIGKDFDEMVLNAVKNV